MRERLRHVITLLKAAGERYSDCEGPRLGASFSFYAIFSIFPLVLLTVTVIGFVIGDDAPARQRVLGVLTADSTVRQAFDATLTAMQQSRSSRGFSAVIGLCTLLFGASGAFVELDAALNRIWGVPVRKGEGIWGTIRVYLLDRLTGLTIVVGLGLTLIASLLSSAILESIGAHAPPFIQHYGSSVVKMTELFVSNALLCAVFVAAFHFIPRSRPPIHGLLGGAFFTTVLITGLKEVFAAYLGHLTSYSAYGVAGGFLGLATWIYLSSQIIFFGAQVTKIRADEVTAEDSGGTQGGRPGDGSAKNDDDAKLARSHVDADAVGR